MQIIVYLNKLFGRESFLSIDYSVFGWEKQCFETQTNLPNRVEILYRTENSSKFLFQRCFLANT